MKSKPLRILFGSAHPYLPQMIGGAQASTHDIVTRLRRRGHDVAVLGGLTGDGAFGLRRRIQLKLSSKKYVKDTALGYPVYRAWFAEQAVREVVKAHNSDIAIFQSFRPVELARAIDRKKVKTFIYLRNVEVGDLGGTLDDLADVRYIANSFFTGRRFEETNGLECKVIYPMIEPNDYMTETSRENVTFINPHPSKGVGIALGLARACPDIPFVFVRGWGLSDDEEASLQEGLKGLTNVTLRESTTDMRDVYKHAKIVLVPSQWEEAFGRVAAEAQVSGIPVLASNIGGLPEAVGPGGTLVAPGAPLESWVSSLKRLWNDETAYAGAVEGAYAHAARDEMAPDLMLESLLKTLQAEA